MKTITCFVQFTSSIDGHHGRPRVIYTTMSRRVCWFLLSTHYSSAGVDLVPPTLAQVDWAALSLNLAGAQGTVARSGKALYPLS